MTEFRPIPIGSINTNSDIGIGSGTDDDINEKPNKPIDKTNKYEGKLSASSSHDEEIEYSSEEELEEIYDIEEPWNYRIQLLLKKIGERAMGYKYMHIQDQYHYVWVLRVYFLIEVVVLSIIGMLTGGQLVGFIASSDFAEDPKIVIPLNIIQILIVFLYAIIRGFRMVGGYEDNIWSHKYNSAKFNEIFLEIQEQLSLPTADRAVDKEFLKYIIKQYNGLLETSPKIRQKSIKKYLKSVEDENIFKPITIGGFEKIEIVINKKRKKENKDKDKEKSKTGTLNRLPFVDKFEIDRWLKHL